jgi:hypothetical protein
VALLQQMVERAESQEARVEFIDDPEPRLDDLEGVGALLRIFESDAIAEARQAEARGEAR